MTSETDTKEDKLEELNKSVPCWYSARIYLAIIGFFGFINIYAQRVCMSVAIVCMVNQTAVHMLREEAAIIAQSDTNLTSSNDVYLGQSDNISTSEALGPCGGTVNGHQHELDGPFVWDKTIQGHILGSFFYGYIISQIPGGLLAERFGAKRVMAIFVFISTIGTLLTPIAAQVSYGFLISLRILVGIGSGAAYPAMHALWSQWAPPLERSKLAGFTYAGSWMGMVIGMPLSGFLCKHGFSGGWPSIFYVFGIYSLLWLVVWMIFVSDTPAIHPKIKAAERDYITKSLKGQLSTHSTKKKIPWLKFMTSLPVWAIIVANVTTDWGLYTFLTNLPTYMHEVLKFDIQSNTLLSALPFIGMWVNMSICPIIVDKVRSSGAVTTGCIRKLMMFIGSVGAAVFLVGLAFLDCTQASLAVAMLTLGVTISGCVYCGFLVNHMDIAPKYAGTLLGISNCLASCTGFFAPMTVAALTKTQSQHEWQQVFFVSAAIFVFGAIFYLIFASGELQEWGKEETSEECMEMAVGVGEGDKEDLKENGVANIT